MFGDDLSPTVTATEVGLGGVFGRAREEGRGLTREIRLGLAVRCSAEGNGLRREKRETRRLFPETENVRR